MKTIKVGNGQQLEDIALVEYGDAAASVLICSDNTLGMDDLLYAGQELFVRTPAPEFSDNSMVTMRNLANEKITPNSGVNGVAPLTGYALEDYFLEDYN